MEFKGTHNWRLRKVNDGFFFIEADLPNALENGHYPRLEVMQEDFGGHNGYTQESRMVDAQLIAHAPKMLEMLIKIKEKLANSDMPDYDDYEDIESLIKSATETIYIMKAKKKAEELIEKFLPLVHRGGEIFLSDQERERDNAKDCAIICVKQILEAVTTIADKKYDYWKEVLTELEK